MWLKLIIMLTIIAFPRQSVLSLTKENLNLNNALSSSASTPILETQSKQLGGKCLVLPELDDPSFKTLIEAKCYVDKTAYLDKLTQRKTKFYFLSRPRRFGKTLLVDTMEEFFKCDGREELFESTEIYQRHPCGWLRYPTIRIDFSEGISSDSISEFKDSLMYEMKTKANEYNIALNAPTVEGVILEYIRLLKKKFNSSVVILVDEYDSPYTRCFAKNKDEASKILGILQSFYSTLKGAYKKIQFCFVTGITRLALSDFFSGFNTAVDLTMDPEYAGIVGFNETELHEYFGNQIKSIASKTGKKEKEIMEKMRTWHDGFQFSEKSESVYSPCSVFGYLKTKAVSTTSWSDTGGPSRFLIEKLKEFPEEALKFFVNQQTNYLADKMEEREPPIIATRRELTGKVDFTKHDVRALTALLFHNGYFSIRQYNAATDSFTLNFTNLELREDYLQRLAQGLAEKYGGDLVKKITLIANDLNTCQWESFCKKLDSYNAAIPYQITVNQRKGIEAWFQFNLFLVLHFAHYKQEIPVAIEESTSMGRIDIVFTNGLAVYIFEPKMEHNPENPVYECKEKYVKKYLFNSKKNVYCIGLKFSREGNIDSWGVASFSYNGELIQEEGSITLTNQLSSKEHQDISNITKMLEPDSLSEFLEKVGPIMEDQLIFAKKFFKNTPIETLYHDLEEIKPAVVQPNIKGILFSFLKAANKYVENLAIEKPVNSALLHLSEILRPVQVLFVDDNTFPISFADFVRFIYQCEKPKEASSIVSDFTEDIPNLFILLNKSYPLIKDSLIRGRITRIQKALKKD